MSEGSLVIVIKIYEKNGYNKVRQASTPTEAVHRLLQKRHIPDTLLWVLSPGIRSIKN